MIFEMQVLQGEGAYWVSTTGYEGGHQVLEFAFSDAKTPATAVNKARRDIARMETAINRMKL